MSNERWTIILKPFLVLNYIASDSLLPCSKLHTISQEHEIYILPLKTPEKNWNKIAEKAVCKSVLTSFFINKIFCSFSLE